MVLEQLQDPHPLHLSSPSVDKQLSKLFGVCLRRTISALVGDGVAVSKYGGKNENESA